VHGFSLFKGTLGLTCVSFVSMLGGVVFCANKPIGDSQSDNYSTICHKFVGFFSV